jgi:hypothetical protein
MARAARNFRPIPRFFQSGGLPALFFLALVMALVPGLAAAAGTWSDTDRLNDGRYGHTATLLRNGKVLVVGGYGYIGDGNWGYHKRTELYDPDSRSWTWAGSLAEARLGNTATLLPNGKVLVAGGYTSERLNDAAPVIDAELYDPATSAWTYTGALAGDRYGHTATLLPNGKVLVAGGTYLNHGSGQQLQQILYSAELYNPDTGTWTPTGSMVVNRSDHTATLLPNGKVLVAGGFSGSGLDGVPVNSAELYDPVSGTWTATGALAVNRYWHTATLLPNGQVLVAGGDIDAGTYNSNPTYSAKLYASPPGVFHTVTASVTGTGLILPSEGGWPVGDGSAGTFFFVRAPRRFIKKVVVDGTTLANAPKSYTFSNVTADHTLSVTFLPSLGGFIDVVTDKTLVQVFKGRTTTFRVKLSSYVETATSVSVTKENGSNEEITVAGGANLSFDSSNWDTYQTVTLAATGNPDGLNGIATFRVSGSGLTSAFVAAKKVKADQTAINQLLLGD